ERLVDYVRSAARRLEVRKRILLLMGPVGGGKSTLVTLLKQGLERYTRTEQGAVYAIEHCPMHEEPLHLVPAALRAEIEQEHGLYIEGDLCPFCHYWLRQDGSPAHPWGRDFRAGHAEDVPVVRLAFSEKDRRGIGTFTPSDPKCVSGDTILLTDRGMLRFDEIQREVRVAADRFTPLAVTVEGRGGRETTSHFYNGGVKPTRRIATRLGYELEGSLVHPVLVLRDGEEQWIRLGDLAIGDCVGLRRGNQLFGARTALPVVAYTRPKARGHNGHLTLPTELQGRRARLLAFLEGLCWGDGTISARKALGSNRFKIATASEELARQLQVILLNLGVLSARYRETIKERFTAWSVVVTGDAVVDLVALIPSL